MTNRVEERRFSAAFEAEKEHGLQPLRSTNSDLAIRPQNKELVSHGTLDVASKKLILSKNGRSEQPCGPTNVRELATTLEPLLHQHAIPIRIKPIPLPHRVLVRPHHILFPAQRAHQHQQRRLRQMKIRQQRPHHLKFVSRINKQIRLTRRCTNLAPTLPRRTFRRILQSPNCCSPDRNDPPQFSPCPVNLPRRVARDRIRLRMQSNVFHPLRPHRLKGSQPNMQRNFTSLNPALPHSPENLLREMQPRRRSRHRPPLLRIHRLIPLPIPQRIRPRNIRRQRHMPNPLDQRKEVVHRRKSNPPLPKLPAPNHLSLQFILLPKEQPLPHPNLPPRPRQTFPLIRLPQNLPRKQNLNPPGRSRIGVPHPCRVFRDRVGVLISILTFTYSPPAPPPKQPRRKHSRIVKHHQIVRPQPLRKLAKLPVTQLPTRPHTQHPRPRPVRQRFLRNQFFGKFEIEIRDQHALIIDSGILSIIVTMTGIMPRPARHLRRELLRLFPKNGLSPLPAC